jgi:hypothetical protein
MSGRDEDAQPEQHEQAQAAQPGEERVGPVPARDGPDGVQRVLERLGHPQPAVQADQDPDDQRRRVALEVADVAAQLVADHRELAERRVDHVALQVRMAVQDEAQDRREQQ